MRLIQWDEEKNAWLRRHRSVSFEAVAEEIRNGRILIDEPHPKLERYPNQRILVVRIDGYVHVVPYVSDETRLFLKTIYRSRVYQKRFAGD
jgi:uncharacterized DUF497 family protein